jgi:hypothetical protein
MLPAPANTNKAIPAKNRFMLNSSWENKIAFLFEPARGPKSCGKKGNKSRVRCLRPMLAAPCAISNSKQFDFYVYNRIDLPHT